MDSMSELASVISRGAWSTEAFETNP